MKDYILSMSRIFFPSSLLCLRFQFSGNVKGWLFLFQNSKEKIFFTFSNHLFHIDKRIILVQRRKWRGDERKKSSNASCVISFLKDCERQRSGVENMRLITLSFLSINNHNISVRINYFIKERCKPFESEATGWKGDVDNERDRKLTNICWNIEKI